MVDCSRLIQQLSTEIKKQEDPIARNVLLEIMWGLLELERERDAFVELIRDKCEYCAVIDACKRSCGLKEKDCTNCMWRDSCKQWENVGCHWDWNLYSISR